MRAAVRDGARRPDLPYRSCCDAATAQIRRDRVTGYGESQPLRWLSDTTGAAPEFCSDSLRSCRHCLHQGAAGGYPGQSPEPKSRDHAVSSQLLLLQSASSGCTGPKANVHQRRRSS